MSGEIRIYVACLASYNNGILHGRWIDATQGRDGIWEDVSAMLADSPEEFAEEWAIHDYEGFEGFTLSEWTSFERVAEIAKFILQHGALGGLLAEHFGSLKDAKRALDECYQGEYPSLEDYAEECIRETMTIPPQLEGYVDFQSMGEDMAINDVFTIETGFREVHVFWHL